MKYAQISLHLIQSLLCELLICQKANAFDVSEMNSSIIRLFVGQEFCVCSSNLNIFLNVCLIDAVLVQLFSLLSAEGPLTLILLSEYNLKNI